MATFRDLLTNYQSATPCTGPFPDQCAIRIGTALSRSGVSLATFSGARCWNHSGPKHVLRAEELANWIRVTPFAGRGATRTLRPANFQDQIDGETGIVFFKDYWRRGAETVGNRSGDHIDLWNVNRLAKDRFSFSRWFQEWMPGVSDLNDSRRILFWEVR